MKKAIQIKEVSKVTKSDRYVDLTGFKMQDELNPKIWDKNQKLRPEIRKTLLKIADDYFESLELGSVDIEDVTFTGSLANYNWSQYSDVDLHMLIDYKEIPVDESLVQDFLKTKSASWNQAHDIKIYGYDVELYVQNSTEVHFSTGVYSVLFDEWIKKPVKEDKKIDTEVLKGKINQWMSKIDTVIKNATDEDIESAKEYIKNLKDKLKKFRSGGLKEGGEYSYENLTFKYLRRNGYLDKLFNFEKQLVDRELSLD